MTGRDVTAQAIAETRKAVREQNRLAALPLSEAIERARQRVYARAAAGAKPVLPLALQTALAADERTYREPGKIVPPDEKTPERVRRRGMTSPLGVMVRGMLLPGATPKEGSKDVYASKKNYLDRQCPPEREEREREG